MGQCYIIVILTPPKVTNEEVWEIVQYYIPQNSYLHLSTSDRDI
jgi:hypothetical protein